MTASSFSCSQWLVWCTAAFFVLYNSFELVQGQCLDSQRSLLVQLKHEFNTTSWGNDTSKDCCKWSGVTCTDGYVTGLDLSNEGIAVDNSGFNDTSALFELRNLTTLSLAQNLFNAEIPPGFAKLGKLIHLNLSNAGFMGQIPFEISTLTRLVTLDITSPSIFRLRVENPSLQTLIGNMSNLVDLRLRNVDLSTQSSDWCKVLSSSFPHLQFLDLSRTALSGPIDPVLQNLKSLSIIHLSDNSFPAPFPNFFSSLRNLSYLNLADSGMSGNVSEKMFQVPTLRFFDLSNNYGLQGNFPTIIKNSSLETLLLRNTEVWKTIPDSIWQLKKLSRLDLFQCQLVGEIPKSISQLTNLVSLTASSNELNGSIPSFSLAENLRKLDLSNNRLTGSILSNDWKRLTNLEILLLHGNFLNGKIPTSLFGISSLNTVSLSGNTFTGFTNESISPSSRLQNLELSGINLYGDFPSFIFGLHGLQVLDLSDNNFSSTLHLNSLNQLKDLTHLYLSHSNLVVETGTETALFQQLKYLGLASCGLKQIPSFLKNHAAIEILDLSENQIQGQIPSWIWVIRTLTTLRLSRNLLQGFEKTSSNSGIQYVDLSANLLNGGVLPHLVSVMSLNLSNNHLNTTLSSITGSFSPALVILDISKNNLYGSIPETICKNTDLHYLDLSENTLSGAIPECLPNIDSIGTLNLRKNNLSGISDTFDARCDINTLDLSSNILHGNIPKSLGNCVTLGFLDLSNNKFESMIPYELRYIEYLQYLNASYNKLTGSIPTYLGNLRALASLDLAKNQLSGMIPKQLGSLESLTFLNVSYNQLVGMIPKVLQLRKFTEASFEGNKGLCGLPLKIRC